MFINDEGEPFMWESKTQILTADLIQNYAAHLQEQERTENTVKKYVHDLNDLLTFLNGRLLTKAVLIEWKGHLINIYAPATVNSMLAAVNGFLSFMEWRELTVRSLKLQKALFRDEKKELTRAEYTRLVNVAKQEGNERLTLILQTICTTGIRVSELRFITAEAVKIGRAEISNKGKHRPIFLPKKLRWLLQKYLQKQKITAGAVFVTRTGKPIDRSNIWRDMKALCKSAEVDPGKVFPQNLRHLFARTYYSLEKDLSRLADILGHSSINTTRIYTAESGYVHARQMERLGLIIT